MPEDGGDRKSGHPETRASSARGPSRDQKSRTLEGPAAIPGPLGKGGRTADDLAESESQYFKDSKAQLDLDALSQELEFREKLTKDIYAFMKAWSLGLLFLLVLDGSGWFRFDLENGVLIALIGSTGASVFGLFLIVARYFFSRPG